MSSVAAANYFNDLQRRVVHKSQQHHDWTNSNTGDIPLPGILTGHLGNIPAKMVPVAFTAGHVQNTLGKSITQPSIYTPYTNSLDYLAAPDVGAAVGGPGFALQNNPETVRYGNAKKLGLNDQNTNYGAIARAMNMSYTPSKGAALGGRHLLGTEGAMGSPATSTAGHAYWMRRG